MPGKGRRVASRQAQIGRRKRRQNRGPSGAPYVPPQSEAPQRQAAGSVATQVQEPATPAQHAQPAASPRPAPATVQPQPIRARADRAAAYNYVVPELRRILVLAGILTIVLIVLAFFV